MATSRQNVRTSESNRAQLDERFLEVPSFIVPIDALGVDWRQRLPLDAMLAGVNSSAMLSFGWGDRAFYLTTPTWSDLKASTAFIALTGLDTTVLHVAAVAVPTPDDQTRHLHLSADQYRRLVTYIEASFQHDPDGYAMPIAGAGYGRYDEFFEAKGHYSMFYTCNEWVRRGLAGVGVRAPLWSPFDEALLYQLPK